MGPDHPRHARAARSPRALGKQGFYAQIGLDQDSAYAFAVELMSSAAMIPDAQEGFAAFLEKRKPQFDRAAERYPAARLAGAAMAAVGCISRGFAPRVAKGAA